MKPKFRIEDYNLKTLMHCTNEYDAEIFVEYMDDIGRRWKSGDCYLGYTFWDFDCNEIFYCFHRNTFVTTAMPGYKILEFEDYDWSKYTKNYQTKELDEKEIYNDLINLLK